MIKRWVIVGGCPRSGTTMLGNVLGAAPEAFVTPEAQFASELLVQVQEGRIPATRDAIDGFIASHWRFKTWEMDYPADPWDDARAKTAEQLASCAPRHIVASYAALRGKPDPRVWIDQTPGHFTMLPTIEQSDFDVSAVHIIRDGRGVAFSLAKVDWGPTHAAAVADWWALQLAQAFAATSRTPCVNLTVRYEDLLTEPEAKLRLICDTIGLRFSEKMVASQALAVPKYTQSQNTALGKGVVATRGEAWRNELMLREIEVFEHHAGKLLSILGYPRLYIEPTLASFPQRAYENFVFPSNQRCLQKQSTKKCLKSSIGVVPTASAKS